MRRFFFSVFSVPFLLSFVSCTMQEKALYSWYDYDNAAYKYQKELTDNSKAAFMTQMDKMEKQRGQRGIVPPGYNAEYGFLLYNSGQAEEGLQYMKKEVELYPESQLFIGGIIKRLEQ